MSDNKKTAAIIVAAGKGLRMGGAIPKQYLEIAGQTVLWHTLHAFEMSRTDRIVVVCPAGDEEFVRNTIIKAGHITKVTDIVPGGTERFDSSFRGIQAVMCGSPNSEGACGLEADVPDYVLIHDGVRALVEPELIDRVIDALESNEAVCPAVSVKDTVRIADDDGMSGGIVDRNRLRSIQTPQGFQRDTIAEAYRIFNSERLRGADTDDVTDDAMLVERYLGGKVAFTQGSYKNIKITTPEDLAIAKAFI